MGRLSRKGPKSQFFCHFFPLFSKSKPPLENLRKWVFRGWKELSKNVEFFYLYYLTVFSKSDEDHLHHLRIVFQKCRKISISLNPKKSLFSVEEGKLLGHIISKDGIHIDISRVKAIQQLYFLRNKKQIQSFNGKINCLRRFISNLAEHLKEMTNS